MKTITALEQHVSEQWPKLKQKAQNERSLEKLIGILEEIDDLLFKLELRIAVEGGNMRFRNGAESRTCRDFFDDTPPGEPEIGSQ
jgi:hypothetical protein